MSVKTNAGEGTLLKMMISSTNTLIGNRVTIEGPDEEVEPVDTFTLDSTVKTRRPCKVIDPGTLSLSLYYDPNDAVHQLIKTRLSTPGPIDAFTLIFNDGDTTPSQEAFSGFFKSFKKNGMAVGENLGADVEIQVNSLIVPTAGTP